MIALFDYQADLVNRTRTAFRSSRRVLMVAPTGGGKTVILSHITKGAVALGRRAVIIAHRAELLDQISATLTAFDVSHSGQRSTGSDQVQVWSVQTLVSRLKQISRPDLLIVDEAHHASRDSQYSKITAAWPTTNVLGVTATPQRLDGKGLGDQFDDMVLGPTTGHLIHIGALSKYRVFAPSAPDLSGITSRGGDYKLEQVESAMDKPVITGCAVKHYLELAAGKRAVAFCTTVEHSRSVAEQFKAAGIPAATLNGNMRDEDRKAVVAAFRSGEILVLTSCNIVSEGFDLPAIEAAILLRPTMSLSLYLQQVGRALRIFPGKDRAIILDHAGNTSRHGFPDDPREWSLSGKKPKKKNEVGVTICKHCFAAFPAGLPACPECACVVASDKTGRQGIEQVGGTLGEICVRCVRDGISTVDCPLCRRQIVNVMCPDCKRVRRAHCTHSVEDLKREERREVGRARTLEDLIIVGQRRAYKNPAYWAASVLAGRK